MKPYSKTFRYSKDHKTSIGCSLCAEQVEYDGKGVMRQKAKHDIREEIRNG